MNTVTIDDLEKLDLRIGTVKSVERVEGSEKLLKIIFDIGDGEERQILSGVAKVVTDLEGFVGSQVPLILNLAPRMMMGLESQGMMFCADTPEGPVLLQPASDVPPGSRIK